MPRTTLLRPGQRPPQVTMPQRSARGSKKILLRGPASSKAGSADERPCVLSELRDEVVDEHLVGRADERHGGLAEVRRDGRRQQALSEHLDAHVRGGI